MPTTMPLTIELETQSPTQVVDLTERVAALVAGAPGAACLLYLRHTTAALMITTGEMGVPEDIVDLLPTLTPYPPYPPRGHSHPGRRRRPPCPRNSWARWWARASPSRCARASSPSASSSGSA